jgi:hypothetical protein
VRARSHLESIAQQLKDDDINFESVEITKLQSHLLTRDLFSPMAFLSSSFELDCELAYEIAP